MRLDVLAGSRPARSLGVLVAAVVVGLTATAALAATYTTYYCGDATSYCSLGYGAPKTTASVALRDENHLYCPGGCWARVYYYSQNTGTFGVSYSNGGPNAFNGSSGSFYVYSRCIAQPGYGPYSARCWTKWHT